MVTNPPYGERISTPDLLGTYRMIGETLKRQFKNNDAWVLSYREECFDQIGLKPSIKIPLYNGSLECEFRKYQIFEGKLKDFRSEGNILKTEEEKKAMAENTASSRTVTSRNDSMQLKRKTKKVTSARSNSINSISTTVMKTVGNADVPTVNAARLKTARVDMTAAEANLQEEAKTEKTSGKRKTL